MSSILIISTIFLFVPFLAIAQIEVVNFVDENGNVKATAGWSPPTYGTPVVHYILQHSINGEAWQFVSTTTDTLFEMSISYLDNHRVRVAGVDAEDRQGPFSFPSNTYSPRDSFPAQPGIPYPTSD